MTVLGPLPRRFASSSSISEAREARVGSDALSSYRLTLQRAQSVVSQTARHRIFELGSEAISSEATFDPQIEELWDAPGPRDLGSEESGEAYVAASVNDDLTGQSGFSLTLASQAESEEGGDERWPASKVREDRDVRAAHEFSRLNQFEILEVIGTGHQAIVYRAFDSLLQRPVALKLPRNEVGFNTRSIERLLGEARALARLKHPRIVPIYEAGREGNFYYIAMALIEGRSLADYVAERTIPYARVAEIIADVAEALAYAHSLGIVHRDVKPANIRVDQEGTVYLMDFGIAYRPDSAENLSPPGTIVGTPAYLAPEQARGEQPGASPASDQYSLGAVFYELLCGRPPFRGIPSSVIYHAIYQDPPSPQTINPKIPRALTTICQKAMAKQPHRRYADCQRLADDLRRWIRGEAPLVCHRSWLPWNCSHTLTMWLRHSS
jgi:serine/threonine protein kinase